jgi:hypothetical protein
VNDGKRHAPVSADISQHFLNLVMVLRADLAAFENLPAEGVNTNQKHPTSFLTGAVDMQNVAAAALHVGTQQPYALLVNHLEIGNELPGEVTDGTHRHFDAIMTRKAGSDFVTLAALEKPRQTDPGQNIVGILRTRGDDARQLL